MQTIASKQPPRSVGVWYFFIITGLAIIAISAFFAFNTMMFVNHASKAEGTVIDFRFNPADRKTEPSYNAIIQFTTAAGKTEKFIMSLASRYPMYPVGTKVPVLYSPDVADSGRVDNFKSLYSMPTAFTILGGLLFLVGLVGLGILKGYDRRDRNLMTHGVPLVTTLTAVNAYRMYVHGGGKVFRINSQWLDPSTQLLHVFKSRGLWFDPTTFIPPSKEINVYIARGNPKKYVMDLSFLPKKA